MVLNKLWIVALVGYLLVSQSVIMSLYTYSKSAQMAIITGFSALVAVDFIGNTLVILVVLKNKTNTPMNYLLLNLALADLLLAIFIGPRFIFSHLFNHPTGITGDMIVWLFIVVVRCLLLLAVSY